MLGITQGDLEARSIFIELYIHIKNNNLNDLKLVINFLSQNNSSDQFSSIFKIQDAQGENLLASAISPNDIEIFKFLLSSLSSTPEVLREVLTSKNKQGNSALHQAIISNKPEIVKEILSSTPTAILLDILLQKDEDGFDSIYLAIILNKVEIIKEILSSTPLVILREVLTHENKRGNSALHQAFISDKPEIVKEILSSLSSTPEILREVLTHENKHGNSALHQAIISNKPEIVKEILSSQSISPELLSEVLQQRNKKRELPIFCALKVILYNDDPDNKNPDEILKLLIKNQFEIHLNDSQKDILTKYAKNYILLNLMSEEKYGFTAKILIKILNEIITDDEKLSSNPIAKIYQEELIKFNSDQPIITNSNKSLYLYTANPLDHHSYLVFEVDQTTNKLLSINYCDGNFYPKLLDKKVNYDSRRSYGVRKYQPSDDIQFTTDFAKKFIAENFSGKDIDDLKLPFKIDDQEFKIKKRIDSIDTVPQSRGNCTFKTSNLQARYLFQEITSEDHHPHYQKFKEDLRVHVILGFAENYQQIKDQFGEKFVDHLEIKEKLQKIALTKFGKKNSKIFEEILKKISRDDVLSFQDRPDPEIQPNCFSCLTLRISRSKTPMVSPQ